MARRGRDRIFNGWRILFNEPFTTAYGDLSACVRWFRTTLPDDVYRQHPEVKLFAALYRVVYEIVPDNPGHPDFRLEGSLKKFRRVKGRGLPSRYRLFFVFMDSAKTIVFLYVNDRRALRKAGDTNDPYQRFRSLVDQGVIGSDFEENYLRWQSG